MSIKIDIYNKVLLLSFSIFIFFFDFLKDYVDLRLFIFVPFLLANYEIFISKKRINYKFLLYFLIVLLLLNSSLIFRDINIADKIYSLKSIFFLIVTTFAIFYFANNILKNLDSLFNFFLIFFFIYIVFYTFYEYDIHLQNNQCYIGCFSILDDKLKFFKENSHLGFISSAIISYLIIKINKVNVYFLSLLIFYLIIILNFSLTVFFTIPIVLFYFLIFYHHKFNYLQKSIIIFLILSSFYILSTNSGAINKLYNVINFDNWNITGQHGKLQRPNITLENNNKNLNRQIKENDVQNKKDAEIKLDNYEKKPVKNLSSEVLIVSFNIAKLAIQERPLGYGFNNYHLAFKKYIDQIEVSLQDTKILNIFDASNNFAKIIVEFGIFGFFIFYIYFKFLFSKKIPFEYKFIIFPSLFTQTFIRGAGYFNGGYIFFFALSCYLIYKFKD